MQLGPLGLIVQAGGMGRQRRRASVPGLVRAAAGEVGSVPQVEFHPVLVMGLEPDVDPPGLRAAYVQVVVRRVPAAPGRAGQSLYQRPDTLLSTLMVRPWQPEASLVSATVQPMVKLLG